MTSSITSIISLSFAWTILCCFIVDVYSFNNDGLIPLRGFRPIPRSDPHSSSHQTKSFEVPREYTYVYSNKNTNYGKSLGHQNPLTPSASAIHVTKTKLTAMPVVSASELSGEYASTLSCVSHVRLSLSVFWCVPTDFLQQKNEWH